MPENRMGGVSVRVAEPSLRSPLSFIGSQTPCSHVGDRMHMQGH